MRLVMCYLGRPLLKGRLAGCRHRQMKTLIGWTPLGRVHLHQVARPESHERAQCHAAFAKQSHAALGLAKVVSRNHLLRVACQTGLSRVRQYGQSATRATASLGSIQPKNRYEVTSQWFTRRCSACESASFTADTTVVTVGTARSNGWEKGFGGRRRVWLLIIRV